MLCISGKLSSQTHQSFEPSLIIFHMSFWGGSKDKSSARTARAFGDMSLIPAN
jgi:hypothetical protein